MTFISGTIRAKWFRAKYLLVLGGFIIKFYSFWVVV